MLGYRPHADVLAAMARAAIVVVPSRWQEPFGLTALEAMACGAALVCSPRGGLPEVGGDAALYADPDDPPAVAEAIVALARETRRATVAGRGRASNGRGCSTCAMAGHAPRMRCGGKSCATARPAPPVASRRPAAYIRGNLHGQRSTRRWRRHGPNRTRCR